MPKKSNSYSKVKKSSNTTKNSKSSKSKSVNLLKPIKDLFSGDRKKLRLSVGGIFFLVGIYQLFAFLSYLFTWKTDQDKIVSNSLWDLIFVNKEIDIDNHLGKLGAWTSHLFFYDWFGIPSFIFPFLFFVFGLYLLSKYAILPLGKTLGVSLVGLIVLSLVFGFFNSADSFPYGGSFGFQFNNWLKSAVGSIGAALFLILIIFITVVVLFNPNFKALITFFHLDELFHKKEKLAPETEEEDQSNLIINDIIAVNPIKEDEIEKDQLSEPVSFEETIVEEIVKEAPKVKAVISDDFEIEHNQDEPIAIIESTTEVPTENKEEEDFQIEIKEEEILADKEIDDKLKEFGEYDPKLDLSAYQLPNIELLEAYGGKALSIDKQELEENKNKIVEVLGHYKIEISKIKATVGPTVTLYEIVPAPGIRISKIKNLSDDIALSLAALGIRIIAPIPGKGTIGIEVPNSKPDIVSMRTMIASEKFQNSDMELPVVLGKTISNETFIFDLAKAPHLLVAGATGQGKSVGLNAILVSILYKKHPAQVKFVMVDPKKVELTLYNKIERHFLAKLPDTDEAIITDTGKVVNTMNSLCIEMDDRYELLKMAQVRNLKEYNTKFIARKLNPEKGHRFLPYIVVVIDEFADLIMTAGKEIEHPIARLAQLARAIGIHLIVATQRPSVNVITGMIKANFPARIAFKVSSGIDSKTILDSTGADQLIGRGDMLISFGNDLTRVQCAFVDTPEVERICDFIGNQRAYPSALMLPEYVGENEEGGNKDIDIDERDDLFRTAAEILVTHQQGSASLLQRKLKIGYNRAGRIIDQMEALGVIGPFKGSKAREVLISDLVALEHFLNNLD
ncbi:DNA translocase FtsK [Putridiphycobacter roseus]|uniref:DNA translocase FtsK n=1 Tax=Putridiphycobacter roseus TaxID=2219161 RepID=A0A2W1NS37_9FLAO|nr:DNA translocase FtsK [Putridiphycobacter roseus]PZE17468.1 DNA translocase FtsK [Putridiphycobacter roseus]